MVSSREKRLTYPIHRLALGIHDIVVLEKIFANVEVSGLDFRLRVFNGLGDPRMFDGFVVGHPHAIHQFLDTITGKNTHQIVFQGQVEAGGSWVTLASRTASQLVVDASRLMALGSEDMQAPKFEHFLLFCLAFGFELFVRLRELVGFGLRQTSSLEEL